MIDKSQVVFGIRAVIEAIESGKQVDKVLMKKDLSGDLARELLSVAREYNVPVQRVPVERINRVTRKNHQGVIAFMAAVDYYHVDDIVPALYDEGINPFIVVLDGVTDVRNFGAIARTCECAGVNAIVIPERNSVSVNADAVKTSAGALNYLPVCRERNLVNAVKYLRDSGFMVMGASEKTDLNYTKADFTGPVAIVLGAEDTGISADILRLCDTLVAIPEFGEINSLNVSVAGGIMIYEVVRQRLNDGQNVNS
ncbi:MAG: 23S rRNA (guanosine(2251)-2'-O)-methyltransferase RlmB [Muribaculaceae bacterium]|nr:23S rRNA (guanosine(2251)-2'-O)-methyltransferase RlmB [Muribaculaceae bacterium]